MLFRSSVGGSPIEEARLDSGARSRVDRRLNRSLAGEPGVDESAPGFADATPPGVGSGEYLLDQISRDPRDGRLQFGSSPLRARRSEGGAENMRGDGPQSGQISDLHHLRLRSSSLPRSLR